MRRRLSTGEVEMGKMRMAVVAACAAAVMGMGASAAFAGEITGNGKPLWTNTDQWADSNGVPVGHTLHAKSACAFSGQEDDQFPGTADNPNPDYNPDAGHVQNWGHVKQATGLPGGAGPAGCNPHVGEG
jgi:hypothetical protein